MRTRSLAIGIYLCALLACGFKSHAQSIISGDVTGIVTDSTASPVPNAAVTLTNADTNVADKSITRADGSYRFAFVPPGTYTLSVSAPGFARQERTGVVVTAGQPTGINFELQIASSSTSISVTEAVSRLQTENADVRTTYNTAAILNLPNPGGDITYIAQTAPGVVMNTQSGWGNFVAVGMPATSNLFSINGVNFNDAFTGINNSGASNLTLGSNDIAEASVISNAYSGQYGQYAGSQIIYITKSGSNSFHGDAIYMWNGRYLNANQFFANQSGLPTPFNNFNQWDANVNGPIWKNHTFFDVNYEGLRNVLPTSANLNLIPSPQFQAATLANLAGNGNAAEIPFYQQIFAVYNNAPGASAATPVPASQGYGCQGSTFAGLPAGAACALEFRSTPSSLLREYQWSARVDHTFSEKDRASIRVYRDNGFQPTFTSPFGGVFNAQSNQPQMAGQVSETHIFGPNTVNEFKGSTLFFASVYVPSNPSAALNALPAAVLFSGMPFSSVGAFGAPAPYFFVPNGRREFQYQILDDLSHVRGKHTLRIGFSWFHDTVTDLDFESTGGPIHGVITTDLTDFFNGGGPDSSLWQGFPSSPEEGIRLNTMGGYVADDWKATDRLTISLNLRLEHYANPTCDANCFARLATTFTGAPQPDAASIPYNQLIVYGQHNAYANIQALVWEPRVGIAWQPFHNGNTVIRTGAGLFADQVPGGVTEDSVFNPPEFAAFNISNGAIVPGVPGSLFTATSQANQALVSQFKSGGSFNSISQSVPVFAAPNFYSFPNTFDDPTYYKWNFEIQQAVGSKIVLSVNYSGMHGEHIPIDDAGLNGYCPLMLCPNGFSGLPATAPNPAFGIVQQYLSAGNSNYNGLTISLQRRLSAGFSFNLNYTWSHALDEVSNGGVANTAFGILDTDSSIMLPQNPRNIQANYGNSDYDVRHYVSATMLLTDMVRRLGFHWGPNRVFGGWTLSTNWFFRTGLPFTVINNEVYYTLYGYNYLGSVFASPVTNVPNTCTNAVNTPCLSASEFGSAAAFTGFGTMGRNSIYGPHFFDVDIALMKDLAITEHVTFSFGAQAYNVFNHANFDQPVNDISNPQFGYSIANVGPPTSLLGSFVGGGNSPRFVELKGIIRF